MAGKGTIPKDSGAWFKERDEALLTKSEGIVSHRVPYSTVTFWIGLR
jgi:hypothetical protein